MCDSLLINFIVIQLKKIDSGADNGTNRANCDTSTIFGTNVLWGLLVKSARWAT